MIIEKRKILDALRQRGQHARADWVDKQLPDEVDTVNNAGLFVTLRIDPADLGPTEPGAAAGPASGSGSGSGSGPASGQ